LLSVKILQLAITDPAPLEVPKLINGVNMVAVALHHLALHCEAQEVQLLMDFELGHHHCGSAAHGGVVHWRPTRHYCKCLLF